MNQQMSKKSEPDFDLNEITQEAWDWLSVTSNAIVQSRLGLERLYEIIAKRSIEAANKEYPVPENGWIQREVYFQPTQDEREKLLQLYNEWQFYKTLHEEYWESYEHVLKNKKPFDKFKDKKDYSFEKKIIKAIFYGSVFIASVIVIANAF